MSEFKTEKTVSCAIISFSLTGGTLAEQVKSVLEKEALDVTVYALKKYAAVNGQLAAEPNLKEWCGRQWDIVDLIVFVGASGIAVRTIAPWVKSKVTDPAVLVMDEGGSFVISLLSGHLGGANAWASLIAGAIDAIPVITTATDVEHLFAVDVWAKDNDLAIASMKLAKEVSADLLHGKTVYIGSEVPWEGKLPAELTAWMPGDSVNVSDGAEFPVLIWCGVSVPADVYPAERILHLIPRCLVLGIGCRRGKDMDTIRAKVTLALKEAGYSRKSVKAIASIDLKKDEQGLIGLAEELQVPFSTWTSAELLSVEGDFTPSPFVSSITGVDNVCERSAAKTANGPLVIKKQAGDGVTVACALSEWRIRF